MGFHAQKSHVVRTENGGTPSEVLKQERCFQKHSDEEPHLKTFIGGRGEARHKRLIIISHDHILSHVRGIGKSMSATLRTRQGVQKRIVGGEIICMDRLRYICPTTRFRLDDLGPIAVRRDPWLQRVHRAYL